MNKTLKNDIICFYLFKIFFCENHPAARHIKYKVISFDRIIISIMANNLASTNLEGFIRRIRSPLMR